MTTWPEAHRLAIAGATRLLNKHGLSPVDRVPVLDLADREQVVVKFAPLPHIAGAYVKEADSLPGIVVNNRLPMAKQRYTLGHELGHHVFDHATSLDSEIDFFDPAAKQTAVPDHEKVAEAFAAWLLMPRSLIQASIERLGVRVLSNCTDVYRLSLLAGASYRATCVHLLSLKLISQPQAAALLRVQPKLIKRRLLDGTGLSVGASDVVVVGPSDDGRTLHVASGDVLLVGGATGTATTINADLPSFLVPKSTSDIAEVLPLVVRSLGAENPIRASESEMMVATTDGTEWSVTVVANHPLSGVSERWFE